MNVVCLVKGHKWDGCQCIRCCRIRDEKHKWNGCKCERCDATRDEEHKWDGCQCIRCRRTRDEECKCYRCGGGGYIEMDDWATGITYKTLCSNCGGIGVELNDKPKDEPKKVDEELWD